MARRPGDGDPERARPRRGRDAAASAAAPARRTQDSYALRRPVRRRRALVPATVAVGVALGGGALLVIELL